MPNSAKRKAPSLQYRWGFVGILLAVAGFIWFVYTSGIVKYHADTRENPNVKISCPRCRGDAVKKINCSLCGGKGIIWVDKTKYLPSEIVPIE